MEVGLWQHEQGSGSVLPALGGSSIQSLSYRELKGHAIYADNQTARFRRSGRTSAAVLRPRAQTVRIMTVARSGDAHVPKTMNPRSTTFRQAVEMLFQSSGECETPKFLPPRSAVGCPRASFAGGPGWTLRLVPRRVFS